MGKHLKTTNLVPFHRRSNGFRVPTMHFRNETSPVEQLDPDLSPEECAYVEHFLSYADRLLAADAEEQKQQGSSSAQQGDEDDAQVA